MAIEMRNKRDTQFSTASMSDLVFLLLIFFMLTSTLVSPNAIKLLLPSSNSKTMATQNLTVYINKARNFYVEDRRVEASNLQNVIFSNTKHDPNASIVLRSDKTAPVQDIVVVIDAVNNINNKYGTKHKVILATKPKK